MFQELPLDMFQHIFDNLSQYELLNILLTNKFIYKKKINRDTDHLRDVLSNKIQKIKGIQRTETFISLDESIERPLNVDL